MRELTYPPEAAHDPDALEMIRGWIVDGELQISISVWVWKEEPAQWGRLLADTVNHLSDAISQESGRSKEEVFEKIAQCLRYYLKNPKELQGDFVEPEGELDS